eukprot:3831551-Amphidinium_carterae.2
MSCKGGSGFFGSDMTGSLFSSHDTLSELTCLTRNNIRTAPAVATWGRSESVAVEEASPEHPPHPNSVASPWPPPCGV